MHHVTISNLAGREHVHATVFGRATVTVVDEARQCIEEALALLEEAGAPRANLVRSRLFARNAQARRAASDLRLDVLRVALRASSSSYIDPARLPGKAAMAIDLVALRGPARSDKIVREYEPRIAPPMFVALDGVVHLSGVTDITTGFDEQLANIRATVQRSLTDAGADFSRIVQIAAHISRQVDATHAWRAINAAFGGPNVTVTLTTVDGYSAPEKLVEIETTALA